MYYAAIIMTVIANIFYHLIQKATPNNINPMLSLAVTYATALVASLALLPLFSGDTPALAALKKLNWTSYALGLAIIGLELGFLLAYRAGWDLSLGALVSNTAVSLLLIPLGLLLFKEQLTVVNGVGIAFCFIGLLLINSK